MEASRASKVVYLKKDLLCNQAQHQYSLIETQMDTGRDKCVSLDLILGRT